MTTVSSAIVAGAGIGGLAAAVGLRQAGAEVIVVERASALEPLGAGLSLWPNAVLALRDLGVAAPLEAAAVPRGEAGLYRWDGSPLATSPAAEIEARFGAPLVLVHRGELQDALLGALPSGTVVTGAALERVQQDGAGVHVTLAGGETRSADLLVGADGLRSTVRAALMGDEEPRPSGLVAYRAVAEHPGGGLTGECWGDRRVFGVVPLSGGRAYWYATAPDDDAPSDHEAAARMLAERFASWADPIPALIAGTPPERILRHALFDRPPRRGWSRGRATLLGDAAHPMLPFLGQGACQAIEDAVGLRDALRSSASVPEALERYESVRHARTAQVVRDSRAAGRVAHLRRGWQRRVRDAAVARTPERMRWRRLAATLAPAA